jgi:H+/gluconate symporter-like permease
MNATSPGALMGLAVAAIAVLVLLVTWRKMNAFLALFIAALLVHRCLVSE